jgi:type IV secretory pathway VirB3-like protein
MAGAKVAVNYANNAGRAEKTLAELRAAGVTAELFLITKSFWALLAAIVLHLAGYMACLREPRFFDIWLAPQTSAPDLRKRLFAGS